MRYLITFSYDGSKFSGYQKQVDKITVQSEIEHALKIINDNHSVSLVASGRTDRGVHAINQKAHFDLNVNITLDKLKKALNSIISDSIYIKDVIKVNDDFHARFNVKFKEYVYKINTLEYNPIEKDYVYQYNHELDIKKMKIALKYLEGTHNFKAFTKADDIKDDYVRTIYKAKITNKDGIINISFIGNGFMRYMVRNMVGTLIEIGECKRNPKDIITILESEDRTKAGKTAHPQGLYLKRVEYNNFKF